MNITALKPHVSLDVHDVSASIDFYRRMLGIEPAKVRTGYAKFDVENPPLNLALNEVPSIQSRAGLSHLGIQVRTSSDVLTVREEWLAAGLLTRDEMETECCYAKQDKTWVRDPDGNQWEVFAVLEDHLPETVGAAARGCCTAEGTCATS